MKPITDPDTTCESEEYWETVLRSHKLGLRRGEKKWLSDNQDYEREDKNELEGGGRRTAPHKNLSQLENKHK